LHEYGIGVGVARCLRGIPTGVHSQARCFVITVNGKQDRKCMKGLESSCLSVSNLIRPWCMCSGLG
jgi:hypothetical protein